MHADRASGLVTHANGPGRWPSPSEILLLVATSVHLGGSSAYGFGVDDNVYIVRFGSSIRGWSIRDWFIHSANEIRRSEGFGSLDSELVQPSVAIAQGP